MNIVNVYKMLGAAIALWFVGPVSAIAASVPYDFNFSTAGSGDFVYDDVALDISPLTLDFGTFGSLATSFDSALTASVFGAPPNIFVNNDNTFFNLSGGTAYGLRLSSDGTFCVRPDVDVCVAKGGTTADLAVGTYSIASAVPIPAAVWLFGSGLLGLVGIARRKKT